MNKVVKVLIAIVLLLLAGSFYGMDEKKVDEIFDKIEKAVDPEGTKKETKTMVTKLELSIPAQQIKLNAIRKDKYPDKTRTLSEIPGVMKTLRVFNGEKGWEYSNAMGLREITGKELYGIKFEMLMKNPKNKPRDIFADIQVSEKPEKIGKYECLKLNCIPKKELQVNPVILYVDNKNYFIRKIEMVNNSNMGPVKVEIFPEDYQKMGKVFMALKSTIKQLGMEMKVKLVDVKFNAEVKDSEFEKPKP